MATLSTVAIIGGLKATVGAWLSFAVGVGACIGAIAVGAAIILGAKTIIKSARW